MPFIVHTSAVVVARIALAELGRGCFLARMKAVAKLRHCSRTYFQLASRPVRRNRAQHAGPMLTAELMMLDGFNSADRIDHGYKEHSDCRAIRQVHYRTSQLRAGEVNVTGTMVTRPIESDPPVAVTEAERVDETLPWLHITVPDRAVRTRLSDGANAHIRNNWALAGCSSPPAGCAQCVTAGTLTFSGGRGVDRWFT